MPAAQIRLATGAASAPVLDTQVTTNATTGSTRGFISGVLGSIVDGTSNIYGGLPIDALFSNGSVGAYTVSLSINSASNSGWTAMTLNGIVYLRTAATFTGGPGTWAWPADANNPFSGATTTAVWT